MFFPTHVSSCNAFFIEDGFFSSLIGWSIPPFTTSTQGHRSFQELDQVSCEISRRMCSDLVNTKCWANTTFVGLKMCSPPKEVRLDFNFRTKKKWSIANYIFHIPLQFFFRFLRFVWYRLFIQIYPEISPIILRPKRNSPAFSTDRKVPRSHHNNGCSELRLVAKLYSKNQCSMLFFTIIPFLSIYHFMCSYPMEIPAWKSRQRLQKGPGIGEPINLSNFWLRFIPRWCPLVVQILTASDQ